MTQILCFGPSKQNSHQVQAIPFYGDIQLSLYMGIFLKIDTLQPMEKVQKIAFLVYARKTAKSYMMKTFSWDFKGEIMQQLIQFGRALKKKL